MSTKFTATITTTEDLGPGGAQVDIQAGQRPGAVINSLAKLLDGIALGSKLGTVDLQSGNAGGGTAATGTLTISAGAGVVGGTIGGTLVTVTWATSDAASATALAAAINANATVNKWVSASAANNVVTLTSLASGFGAAVGNTTSLAASGTGVTASGASLTGGVNAAANSFTN